MKDKYKNIKYLPFVIAFITLAVFSVAIFRFSEFNSNRKERDERLKIQDQLILKKSQLEKALYSRIYYTKGVAAYTSLNPSLTADDFKNLAGKLIKNDTVISTMSLAKDARISAIFPLKGHESALGLDLLAHPNRRRIVENTILTSNTFVAGPLDLIEGGIAFISYTPIFTDIGYDTTHFWGVTDIVIYRDMLFNEAGLYPNQNGLIYALKGDDGLGENGKVFWGREDIFEKDPVKVDIYLPTGKWVLASIPYNGWNIFSTKSELLIFFLYIAALIISVLIWLLVSAMLKISKKEMELTALFNSMEDLVIEFDKIGRYTKIAPTNERLLVKPPPELLGKTLHDVFDKDSADFFLNAILQCFATKSLVTIDYPLSINGQEFWFQARISYISDHSVIYVAHDNTRKKLAEDELISSEKKLIELNATKDKFFSIIAHDLKSPIGSFRELSRVLAESYNDFSDDERIEILTLINKSSDNLFSLIDNLLEWSRSQRNKIQLYPVDFEVKKTVDDLIQQLHIVAGQKEINIINSIDQGTLLHADPNIIKTILRNLISNSIKFSHIGGEIVVSSVLKDDSVELSVKDSGVGIPEETISHLFRIDKQVSTIGTAQERGTGLGLVLCKEFIDKQNGRIWVESKLGEGSTFYVTIPTRKQTIE